MSTVVEPPPAEVRRSSPAPLAASPETLPESRHPRAGGIVGGLILVGLGIAALVGNVLPSSGAVLFIGLGAAFLVARVITGRPGYAVPAGLLLAFGAFVALTEMRFTAGREAGGLFFITLGLGFVGTYIIAARPRMVWPILPACALIGFGLLLQGWLLAWPFERLVWLAPYWPLALIVFGGWLLVREQVPDSAREPITIVAIGGLILVGFVVAAAGIATVTTPGGGTFAPFPTWPAMPMFGWPPAQDSVVLTGQLASGDILQLTNTSGHTTVRGGTSEQVRVEAIRHYWSASNPPQVSLQPGTGTLTVQAVSDLPGPSGTSTYVDYLIDVPPFAGVNLNSTSGDVAVSGIGGSVSVRTTSGDVALEALSGPVTVESTSGRIRGSGLVHPVSARSTSGDIDLGGTFAGDGTIAATSGDVTLRPAPGTSARIEASTMSGSVRTSGPGLPAARETRSQTITLGSGGPLVQVRTTSGTIALLSQ